MLSHLFHNVWLTVHLDDGEHLSGCRTFWWCWRKRQSITKGTGKFHSISKKCDLLVVWDDRSLGPIMSTQNFTTIPLKVADMFQHGSSVGSKNRGMLPSWESHLQCGSKATAEIWKKCFYNLIWIDFTAIIILSLMALFDLFLSITVSDHSGLERPKISACKSFISNFMFPCLFEIVNHTFTGFEKCSC